MTVQDAMKLTDAELLALGCDELRKYSDAYRHFSSTKAFSERCEKLLKELKP